MKTTELDFPLPEQLIAKHPNAKRDKSRLMVLNKGAIIDRTFCDITRYLKGGDMLLLNRSKVLPYRLRGLRASGRPLDILLVSNLGGNRFEILSKGKHTGRLNITGDVWADITDGNRAELHYTGGLEALLWKHGSMPIPPYLNRDADESDMTRYQTVYADRAGSIAAPTAGLHFTPELIENIKNMGVKVRYVTLHVGTGTFLPIRADSTEQHQMHGEEFELNTALIDEIRTLSGNLMTVGTTTTRAIEGFFSDKYEELPALTKGTIRGRTDIFITPGYKFKVADRIITNFHLPRSTPLLLASALIGYDNLMRAYTHAIAMEYRFFSYGDAMLIT